MHPPGAGNAPLEVREPHPNLQGTIIEPKNTKKVFTSDKDMDGTAFDQFWALFPKIRAGSKEKAAKALYRAMDRASFEEIMAGLRAYVDSGDPFAENGRYAKGAEAWLNDDRWNWSYGRNKSHTQAPQQKQAIEDIMY